MNARDTNARDGLRAVLFDWDGTLVDSAQKSYRCYTRVFASYGIDYDTTLFERTYAPDWYRTYEAIGLPREVWTEADARWLECYDSEPSQLLPGAREALLALAGRDVAQGLVSSGDPRRVKRELEAHGVACFFSVVVCGGETVERKPHPEPLRKALAGLGLAPAQAAYIGDSPEDVLMARSAGVLAIGVPGGFPNREALAAAAPDLLCPSLESAISSLLR
jgi:phosphoglycolate phosphatase